MPLGTYTLTVTDSTTGCFSTSNVSITEDTQLPDVSIDQPSTITCTNLTVTLVGSTQVANASFAWTTADGVIDSGADQVNAVVSSAGTYTLTITNTITGCVNSSDVIVAENTTSPDISILTPTELTCINPTVSLEGSTTLEGGTFFLDYK